MLSELDWLPRAPENFRAAIREARASLAGGDRAAAEAQLRLLATHALSGDQLTTIAKDWAALSSAAQGGAAPIRFGLIGDGTLSLLGGAIAGSGVRHGLSLSIVEGEYGAAVSDALDEDSAIRTAGLDMLLLVTDARGLGLCRPTDSAADARIAVEQALGRLRMIVDNLRPSVKSVIMVQTIVPPLEPHFGAIDAFEATAPLAMIESVNRELAGWAAAGDILLIDAARLAASVGLERWHDPRHWYASKLGFSPDMLPVYGDVVARTVAAVRGLSRKCLVLDLDNTLWGGVIGDDGVAGIALGQGSAAGEAFLAIQQLAFDLRKRGVVLAVCSKNEEDAARLPFREHPEMVLREEHVAVFQANWTDKAANLKAIAKALNIGVDSLVFLDDNPAERAQVRRELPMVAVPEVSDDPAYYPRIVAAAGYFEAVAFSDEDRKRAGYYQQNAQRAMLEGSASDMQSYLQSLDMVCTIGPIDAVARPRAAQLINKSNQFNLTTRRYGEPEVAAMTADPTFCALQVRLSDRFGDNGLISVVIARRDGESWEIDSWLMSCRVLNRKVEQAVLAYLAQAARADGASRLVGRYIPTAKNRLVQEHYAKLGFTLVETGAHGETRWQLELDDHQAPELPMTIRILEALSRAA